jgi:hypothetical protein
VIPISRFLVWPVLACLLPAAPVKVLSNRYDSGATGGNVRERVLRAANVNAASFGKLYSYPVEGSVFAQPLYVPDVNVQGRGRHNVLYVATMNDKVYAFDADSSAAPLWTRDLTHGGTPVPVADITQDNDLNVVGNVGILSTPVIDDRAHAMYLVARTKEGGHYIQRLYALDIRGGEDLTPPAVIEASVKSSAKDAVSGTLRFDPKYGNQRTALALSGKFVVIAWASHEDIEPYHGWVMAYDSKTLHQAAVWCATPGGTAGGIWQSGRGPVVDAQGDIYFEVGNGDWDGVNNFGESLVKLRLGPLGFAVADYYTPADYADLNQTDADFGSSGPMLLPKTNLVICGDKHGVLTLLDRRALGHAAPTAQQRPQMLPVNGGRVLSGPAYWNGPAGPLVYIWGEADFLKAYHFNGKTLDAQVFATGKAHAHGSPGGALTVSSNGRKAGSGIVWGMLSQKSADHGNAAGVMYAQDAITTRDRLGTLVKFVPPVVARGKVYAVTYDNAVHVYGLLGRK